MSCVATTDGALIEADRVPPPLGWCGGAAIRQPSTCTTAARYDTLLHPENPVVFFDVLVPQTATSSSATVMPTTPHEYLAMDAAFQTRHRVSVELFAHWTPILAKNVYDLALGVPTRVVNGALQPAGYQGTRVFSATPETVVNFGDVVCNNGSGHFSIYNDKSSFRCLPPLSCTASVETTADTVVPHAPLCGLRGIVTMHHDAVSAGTSELPRLGSSLSIRLAPAPSNPMDPFFATSYIVGRVTGRSESQREASLLHLAHVAEAASFELRQHGGGAVLPHVIVCGEL